MAGTAIVTTGPSNNAYPMVAVQTPAQMDQKRDDELRKRYGASEVDTATENNLVGYVRKQWDMMRRHRSSGNGWSSRLIAAQRAFNREYDPVKLAEIMEFQGSTHYSGVIATKCRGTTSLLREVYLEGQSAQDRPWGLSPTPEPTLPDSISDAISSLVEAELASLEQAGEPLPPPEAVQDRIEGLIEHAREAAKKHAREQAMRAEEKVDDFLHEGSFYDALADFLVHLPIFPFACIKGPVVRVQQTIAWVDGEDGRKTCQQVKRAKMFWECVSPFALFFTPGVSDIRDADVIEVCRYTRSDLNALIGVPGYREDQIRLALQEYGPRGHHEWLDDTDAARARGESREDPNFNESGIIDCLEFHGNIQGRLLLDFGMSTDDIDDPDLDYFVQLWCIGRYVIKVQLHPSPRKRHPYFITSFEKVPGTPVGNALPDILGDIGDAANSTMRALINNQAMASGPQVVVNDSRIAPGGDNDSMFPWKRWHTVSDPFNPQPSGAEKPIEFFQPQSNANELMVIYEKLWQQADELSAIPRYTTGSDRMGGAGRTASGLAMLMGNANKILKTVCANIDREILKPVIEMLYEYLMLYDRSGMFRGDENIVVKGVQVAVQKETNRQRQIEFATMTLNPLDQQIMSPLGRAALLRSISRDIGLPGEEIVPDEDAVKSALKQQTEQAMAQQQQDIQQNGERSVARRATPGNAPAPKGANVDLGVQEAENMRGMTR